MTTNVTALHAKPVAPSPRDPKGSCPRTRRSRSPVIGAHGWSGASTLAGFLGDVDDVGLSIPSDLGSQPVVVTAVGSPDGAREAVALLGEFRTMYALPIILAVRGDGLWPDSLALRHRLRVLRGDLAAVIRIPYVSRWGFVDGEPMAPPRYLAAVDAVREALVQASQAHLVPSPTQGFGHLNQRRRTS